MAKNITDSNLSPGVLSLLPLFYVAWSDSVLSPSEVKLIHKKINALEFLQQHEKKYLIKWTDPINPPGESIFKLWIKSIKSYATQIPPEKKKQLIDLGIEIAQHHTDYRSHEIWKSPNTKAAILDIQESLGIQSELSSKLLLSKLYPDAESFCPSCSFDPVEMQNFLDAPYQVLRSRMRKLLRDPFFRYQVYSEKENYRNRVLSQLIELAKQGLSAYAFPKEHGGLDRIGEHIVAFEMLAYSDLSLTIKFGVQFGLFGGAIHNLGTIHHHEKYLKPMINADLLGCFAMTETAHGSNVKGLKTEACYDPGKQEFTIHSPTINDGKEYIGNALHASIAVVFAQLTTNSTLHGVHAFLVPLRNEEGQVLNGIRIEDSGLKMGLNGVDNGKIWFDKVKIPRENLLDKYGHVDRNGTYSSPIKNPSKRFFTMLGTLVTGRISVGLASNNVTKSALSIALKYSLRRKQFHVGNSQSEQLIIDYPSHQHRLFPLLSKCFAFHFALNDLSRKSFQVTDDIEHRKIETLAAGLKAKSSWLCTKAVQESREACGGKGYLWENRIPALKADSDIFTTFEGDNTVLLQLVAKSLLTEFKEFFHDEGFRAVIRYLLRRFQNRIDEWNPMQARNTNTKHLLASDFHIHSFKYREQKLLHGLSQRMQNYLKKRIEPSLAFLKCQNHMIAMAHAFIDRICLESFLDNIEKCENASLKKALTLQCQLFALTTIEEEKGFFLENDFMDGSKTKAIRRNIIKLYQQIRPDVIGLIDSFGIPEELLGANIISDEA